MTRILALVLLLVSPAGASDWGFERALGEGFVSLERAVEQISAADQRQWLSYLASPELDGRVPNRPGYGKAVDYIESHCKRWGLSTARQRVPDRDENLFAYLEGSEIPEEIVVVGAHLDHLGNGRLGADDNASGSVAIMSAARAFSRMRAPRRTVVFQWYTAEESGLIGSRWYADNPTFPTGRPSIDQHIAMINLDMVGRFRLSGRMIPEGLQLLELSAEIQDYIKRLKPRYPFAGDLTITSGSRSDHASFRRHGVPVAWLFTGTHGDYHTRRDTVDKINFDGLADVARYCTELARLCSEEGHRSRVEPLKIDEHVRIGGEPFEEMSGCP